MAYFAGFSGVPKFSAAATIDPTSVPAGAVSVETFTVAGLKTDQVIAVTAPSLEATLGIVGARASAANTLELKIWNFSAGAVDPASQTIYILGL